MCICMCRCSVTNTALADADFPATIWRSFGERPPTRSPAFLKADTGEDKQQLPLQSVLRLPNATEFRRAEDNPKNIVLQDTSRVIELFNGVPAILSLLHEPTEDQLELPLAGQGLGSRLASRVAKPRNAQDSSENKALRPIASAPDTAEDPYAPKCKLPGADSQYLHGGRTKAQAKARGVALRERLVSCLELFADEFSGLKKRDRQALQATAVDEDGATSHMDETEGSTLDDNEDNSTSSNASADERKAKRFRLPKNASMCSTCFAHQLNSNKPIIPVFFKNEAAKRDHYRDMHPEMCSGMHTTDT